MVIVDAYNVLLADGAGGLELDELADLARSSSLARRGVVLVCDGVRKEHAGGIRDDAGSSGGVRVVSAGRDADSYIEGMLTREASPGRLLVVSNDRRLKLAARRAKASWMASAAFVALLEREQRGPRPGLPAFATDVPLDRASVRYWLRQFGLGDPAASSEAPSTKARPRKAPVRKSTDRPSKRDAGTPQKPKKTGGPVLPPGEVIDPLLLDALEEWALRPEDLDMGRWLERGDR